MYIDRIISKLKKTERQHVLPDFFRRVQKVSGKKDDPEFIVKILENIRKQKIKQCDNIEKLSMIQLFLQHYTSYDPDRCEKNSGTLLKSMVMLPFFSQICGFNSIMLLPHFLRSTRFAKGNTGSPYSVKDYYTVDPSLKDELIPDASAEDLFGAFIEASHCLGMKVFIDMVPRTAARDSLWILENPGWFYWVKPENTEKLVQLLQTYIPGLPNAVSMNDDVIEKVMTGLPVREIISMFEYSPDVSDPEKWERFRSSLNKGEPFLDRIVEEFGVIPPPCTSDCVNDPQPAWTDVTPLRLYRDYHVNISKHLDCAYDEIPPFFIQPVLKASNFKGELPIEDLWEKISEIPHYYSEKFGVDGLRGDMFHALPSELIDRMTAPLKKKDFVLIMENLDNQAGNELSERHGFHLYTGNLFAVIDEGMHSIEYFLRQTDEFNTKILSMPVIGDSVPIFSKRPKEKVFYQLALSAFFPNSAYGVTADTLIQNEMPLNFGLGFTKEMQTDFLDRMGKTGRRLAYFNIDFMNREWEEADLNTAEFFSTLNRARAKVFNRGDLRLVSVEHTENSIFFRIGNGKYCYDIFACIQKPGNISFDINDIIYHINSEISDNKVIPGDFAVVVKKGDV